MKADAEAGFRWDVRWRSDGSVEPACYGEVFVKPCLVVEPRGELADCHSGFVAVGHEVRECFGDPEFDFLPFVVEEGEKLRLFRGVFECVCEAFELDASALLGSFGGCRRCLCGLARFGDLGYCLFHDFLYCLGL